MPLPPVIGPAKVAAGPAGRAMVEGGLVVEGPASVPLASEEHAPAARASAIPAASTASRRPPRTPLTCGMVLPPFGIASPPRAPVHRTYSTNVENASHPRGGSSVW